MLNSISSVLATASFESVQPFCVQSLNMINESRHFDIMFILIQILCKNEKLLKNL